MRYASWFPLELVSNFIFSQTSSDGDMYDQLYMQPSILYMRCNPQNSSCLKQNRNVLLKYASLEDQTTQLGVVQRGSLPKLVLGFNFSQKLSDGYISRQKDI